MSHYSDEEIQKMIDLHYKQKMTYAQIARVMGRSHSSVSNAMWRAKNTRKDITVSEKTLSDFSPRDMIKHLYTLGYRIENNMLMCIQKVAVNLKDIING